MESLVWIKFKAEFPTVEYLLLKNLRAINSIDILRPKQQFNKFAPERFETKLFIILDN